MHVNARRRLADVRSGYLWATEVDHYNGVQFPSAQVLAARGFAGVAMDAYSYFPFGESTLDLVHTSRVYHTGYPRTTLYEVTPI